MKAASRARIEDYVACVRALMAKGEATYQGRPQRVRWASTAVRPRVLDGKNVPDDLRGKIQASLDHYVVYDHVLDEGQNPKRMEALGLTQYALDRFALAGNASDWITRIDAGATRLWLTVSGHGYEGQAKYLRILGEQIMRRFT